MINSHLFNLILSCNDVISGLNIGSVSQPRVNISGVTASHTGLARKPLKVVRLPDAQTCECDILDRVLTEHFHHRPLTCLERDIRSHSKRKKNILLHIFKYKTMKYRYVDQILHYSLLL